MQQPHIQLLSRHRCGLCEEAQAVVEAVAAEGLCSWEKVDVDRDKGLLVRYGNDVPVLLLNGHELCRHRVSEAGLKASLTAQAAGAL